MSKRVLYTVSDSPPGRAVQMALQYLDLTYEVKAVDVDNGKLSASSYTETYPQGELPILDDFGHIVRESVAIIQYLACKYPRDDTFYPKDPHKNAIVHHRLAFYLSTYYRRIHDFYGKSDVKILPMDYAYEGTEDNEKKLNQAIRIFDDILSKQNTQYVAGDKLTIADLPLVMGTVAMKAMEHNLKPFPYILAWLDNFQINQPNLWVIAKEGLAFFNKSPRDMSHMKHPIHPTTTTTTTAAATASTTNTNKTIKHLSRKL